MQEVELVVIGGGPAGLAAAHAAHHAGLEHVVLLERNAELGGILPQCIHNGFGLREFKEDLTGPEYAQRYIEMLKETDVDVHLQTMVLNLSEDRIVTAVNPSLGSFKLKARSIVLAMGCRERTKGAIGIPGSRPSGIFTAGTAQRFINIHGYMPGRKVIVLGSGDVGLIMARRCALEGAEVIGVIEIRPYLTGLMRNKIQCLDDFGIPLRLTHTITRISGRRRLEGVTVAKVDENGIPIPETEEFVECDTLLTSVGLIPENELSSGAGMVLDPRTLGPAVDQNLQTSIPGIFACGNVLLVNDLVDDVSKEGEAAGRNAAVFVTNYIPAVSGPVINLSSGRNIASVVPQKLILPIADSIPVYIRVKEPETDVKLIMKIGHETISKKKLNWVGPGEMIKQKLKLKEEHLDRLKEHGESILVEIQSAEVNIGEGKN